MHVPHVFLGLSLLQLITELFSEERSSVWETTVAQLNRGVRRSVLVPDERFQ